MRAGSGAYRQAVTRAGSQRGWPPEAVVAVVETDAALASSGAGGMSTSWAGSSSIERHQPARRMERLVAERRPHCGSGTGGSWRRPRDAGGTGDTSRGCKCDGESEDRGGVKVFAGASALCVRAPRALTMVSNAIAVAICISVVQTLNYENEVKRPRS